MTTQYQDLGTEQIEATRRGRPFQTLNSEGAWYNIGTVIETDYEGAAKSLVLRSDNQKSYKLGRSSSQYQVIDHRQVLENLLTSGWEVSRVDNTRGGARLFTVLTHPHYKVEDFVVGYDIERYKGSALGQPLGLSLGIWSDARVGHGIRMTMGFIRHICSNGLVSSILQLGDKTFKHTEAGGRALEAWAQNQVNVLIGRTNSYQVVAPQALEWMYNTLVSANRAEGQRAGAGEEQLTQLPTLIRSETLALWRELSQGSRQVLATEIDQLHATGEAVSGADLLNIITNVANTQASATSRIYHNLEALAGNMNKMVEVGALVSGNLYETRNYKIIG